MKIQTRDKDILGSLLKYGLLSSEQIGEVHFKNLHHTTIMRRLRVLEKEKLILRMDSLPNNQCAWSLGFAGAKLLNTEPPGRFSNRNTTLHDVTVSAVRMNLETLGLCQNFSTEMEMKRRINWKLGEKEKESLQIPDGLFMAQMKGYDQVSPVAMEVELHAKSHARYRRIVRQYLRKDSIHVIWYFVKSEGIAQAIHAQWKALRSENKNTIFLFSFIEQAKGDPSKIQAFSTVDGKWAKLTDLFDLPRPVAKTENPVDQSVGREEASSSGSEAA